MPLCLLDLSILNFSTMREAEDGRLRCLATARLGGQKSPGSAVLQRGKPELPGSIQGMAPT